jgi:hypothetical protein
VGDDEALLLEQADASVAEARAAGLELVELLPRERVKRRRDGARQAASSSA